MPASPEVTAVPLPRHLRVALHYATPDSRQWFASLFAFDAMFARVLAEASQPLVAQLRLAWWRDELGRSAASTAERTPLLAESRRLWGTPVRPIIALLDGWESLLDETDTTASVFCQGREEAAEALAVLIANSAAAASARLAARRWSLAELSRDGSNAERAESSREQGRALPPTSALPRPLRPLAVLDALARRSLTRGVPLLDGRRSLLTAMRAGHFGR